VCRDSGGFRGNGNTNTKNHLETILVRKTLLSLRDFSPNESGDNILKSFHVGLFSKTVRISINY
jgi:hypothetical protein